MIEAGDKVYHPQCFRCVHCKRCLDGQQYTKDDQNYIYCLDDYRQLFSPSCNKCGHKKWNQIQPDDEINDVYLRLLGTPSS